MNRTTKLVLSALIAGAVTFVTAYLALLVALPENASLGDIGVVPMTVAVLGAVLQVLKDMKTYIADPPE